MAATGRKRLWTASRWRPSPSCLDHTLDSATLAPFIRGLLIPGPSATGTGGCADPSFGKNRASADGYGQDQDRPRPLRFGLAGSCGRALVEPLPKTSERLTEEPAGPVHPHEAGTRRRLSRLWTRRTNTTDCSCAAPSPIRSPTTTSPVAMQMRAWSWTDLASRRAITLGDA